MKVGKQGLVTMEDLLLQINKKWLLTKSKIQPSLKEIKLQVNE